MNGITQGENEITAALDRLSATWSSLRTGWDDNAQRHFETEYVDPLLTTTPELLAQVQELSALIDQARNSVE
ncbi:MAG TPA: hypothetical protein PKI20_00850 [Verrucomicrobiota bacterium]|jgi:muramidase (phage lysozyme)|nr:hypothetical protein [Verrucomicrobiota bacterium]